MVKRGVIQVKKKQQALFGENTPQKLSIPNSTPKLG